MKKSKKCRVKILFYKKNFHDPVYYIYAGF